MTVPIEWVNIVQAEQAKVGDFAIELTGNRAKGVIAELPSQFDGERIKLFVCPLPGQIDAVSVEAIEGDLLTIGDWRIEVDEASAVKRGDLKGEYGALVLSKGTVKIMIPGPKGEGQRFADLCVVENGSTTSREYAYLHWRAIRMDGLEKIVLLDRQN